MDEETWFGGSAPRDEVEARFLTTLRELAAGWDLEDLQPRQTRVFTGLVPLLVTVELRGLPADVTLQVGWWPEPPSGPALEGEWGDRYLLENHVDGPDGLTVHGLTASPEQFATWTADWLRTQLRRPVERLDWVGEDGAVTTSRWRLADTGFPLTTQGARRRRWSRRPPDRVERVR